MKFQFKKPHAPRISYLAALLLTLPCLTYSASNTKPVAIVNTPDSTICSSSAIERTLPFPVGDKTLYFLNLRDGDKVHSPFRAVFSVSGMGVAPVEAGKIDGTGHHHILIDLDLPQDIKKAIPFDRAEEYQHQHYKHFGKGETETVLNLPPGKHKLRLMFANHQHVPYYIASKEITIEVLPSKG
ncbi:DUF4399 domain-containing protein [Undibacterium sp. Ji49W]|uniref:DUF4399 domain-containing protein n=1 Tax=Undibacterium sp. Ji49W TaxID=3413040 RepID=UPI003BF2027A